MMPWVRRQASRQSAAGVLGLPIASWLVVGLGNPGSEYVRSPHNIGFAVVEELARRHRVSTHSKHKGLYGTGVVNGTSVALLQPLTFMNLSGESVRPAQKSLRLEPARVLIVHDEIDLTFSTVRVKQGGGSAGHNGLKSIHQYLKTQDFPRVRMGVGRPDEGDRRPIRDWILRPMAAEVDYEGLAELGANVVERVLADGVVTAMNVVNSERP